MRSRCDALSCGMCAPTAARLMLVILRCVVCASDAYPLFRHAAFVPTCGNWCTLLFASTCDLSAPPGGSCGTAGPVHLLVQTQRYCPMSLDTALWRVRCSCHMGRAGTEVDTFPSQAPPAQQQGREGEPQATLRVRPFAAFEVHLCTCAVLAHMSGSRLESDDGETPIAPAELPYAQSLLASMREAGRPAPLSVAQTLWPVDLAMLSHKPVQLGVPQEVAERPILVIGCSLGNHMAEVPKFVLQHFVTVVLRVYAGGKLRYGYSECEYVRGQSCTWEGAVDPAPVQQFSELIERLLALGCAPRVAFVGISAGVHKILAVMSDMRVQDDVQVSHVVACAGAWHPRLFQQAWGAPAAQQARWFCQHHVKDTLCRWPYELQPWWTAHERDQEHRVYVRALGDANPLLFGYSQHNTSGPLLSQRAFWEELQNPSANFRSTCVNQQLGLGHLATDKAR